MAKINIEKLSIWQGKAAIIPADFPHRLSPGKVLSVYIDPNTVMAQTLAGIFDKNA